MAGKYNRKDHFYNKAKEDGYRSRAAYKLLELNDKYRLIKPGNNVLELGAWPGGWLEIAAEIAGSRAKIVGIDLKAIDKFGSQNMHGVVGDIREESSIKAACELVSGRFDVVLSDLAPKITGIRDVDEQGVLDLAEAAISCLGIALKPGGNFALKVFKSPEIDRFVKSHSSSFNKFSRVELASTRKTSNEFYLVGIGYKAKPH